MGKLRIGMVGVGFIADWHINGFKANPDAAVTGMCHVFFGSERQRASEMENLRKKCSGQNRSVPAGSADGSKRNARVVGRGSLLRSSQSIVISIAAAHTRFPEWVTSTHAAWLAGTVEVPQ